MSGAAVVERLGTLSAAGQALLKNDLKVDEFLYPLGPGARYSAEDVPPILCTALPHLTDQHEALWDELAEVLRNRVDGTLAEHYRFVFDWLAGRFNKKAWLERSGASLLFVPILARFFPDARFVHIFRDGRDTALSMYRHHFFRLRVQSWQQLSRVGLDAMHPFNLPGVSPWVPFFENLMFRHFDADRYRRTEMPVAAFGAYWSSMIERGLGYLQALPPERVLVLRYESILSDPKAELSRFINFVGTEFENQAWLDAAAAMPVTKAPAWHALDATTQAQLTEACAPGMIRLGYSV